MGSVSSRTVEGRSCQDEDKIVEGSEVVVGGLGFEETEGVVSIIFGDVSEVDGIHSHSLGIDIIFRLGGLVRRVIEEVIGIRNEIIFTRDEITGFVHIQPDTRELDLLVKQIQADFPEQRSVGVVPVRVVDRSGPDLPKEISSVGILDVNVVVQANIVNTVVDSDTSIDNGDPSLLVVIKHGCHVFSGESVLIDGKVNVASHVVDIRPHNIKRELILAVVAKNFFELRDVLVSPSALVETERPEGLQSPASQIRVILLNDSFGSIVSVASEEEVQVNDTSHNLVGELLALFKDQVHTYRGSKETHTEGVGFFSEKIDRVISVGTVSRFAGFDIEGRVVSQNTVGTIRAKIQLVVSFSETKHVLSGQ
jgi:hypothetical protein